MKLGDEYRLLEARRALTALLDPLGSLAEWALWEFFSFPSAPIFSVNIYR